VPAMFRITTQDDTGSTTLKLAGRLEGPWVTELVHGGRNL